MDRIDAVLADLPKSGETKVLLHVEVPIDKNLQETYFNPQALSENELHIEALAANRLAQHYHLEVSQILKKSQVRASEIQAIGAHGQTIRHQPQLT